MEAGIGIRPLADLAANPAAAGVLRVDVLGRGGAYQREPPRVSDTTHLDADLLTPHREGLAVTVQTYPAARCAVLADAVVLGQGSVVTRNGALLLESVLEFLIGGLTPDRFAPQGEKLHADTAPSRLVEAPSLLLKRPWWLNYGHWLTDSAAMLALAARMRLPPGWQIVVGRHRGHMQDVVAKTAALLAPGVAVLEHPDEEAWRFTRLLYPMPLHIPPLSRHPEGLAGLRALVLREALARPGPPRRLFVSRGRSAERQLANEAELIPIAQAAGYEVVQPELHDLPGQARLFHAAECIVGVKGAALANLLFCAAGASALVLSPGDFPDFYFWDVANHAGVTYAELFGRLLSRDARRGGNPFVIDPVRFAALLPR